MKGGERMPPIRRSRRVPPPTAGTGLSKQVSCHASRKDPLSKGAATAELAHAKLDQQRVKQLTEAIAELQDEENGGVHWKGAEKCEFGNIDVLEIQDIIGFIIAMLVLKLLRWVDDLPYLIWQVTFFDI